MQDEGYDRLVRNGQEFQKIRIYIEANPVRAGLATEADRYRWSSAVPGGQGRKADQGSAPPLTQLNCKESQSYL